MICTYCEQEMLDATSCVLVPVKAGGGELEPVRYGSEKREASWGPSAASLGMRCHDCNVEPGGLHHPGCDGEQCPACGGQVISCGCSA